MASFINQADSIPDMSSKEFVLLLTQKPFLQAAFVRLKATAKDMKASGVKEDDEETMVQQLRKDLSNWFQLTVQKNEAEIVRLSSKDL